MLSLNILQQLPTSPYRKLINYIDELKIFNFLTCNHPLIGLQSVLSTQANK